MQGITRRLRKDRLEKRKNPFRIFLQEFKNGEKVVIVPESSYHKAFPHRRFIGMRGKVLGKQGKAYIISIKVGNAIKRIICSPAHLKRLKE